MTKYPSENDLKDQLNQIKNYKDLYPLISSYINISTDNIGLLEYLPSYNNFLNFMNDKYSYSISRKDASKKILEKEDIYTEETSKKSFEEFINSWKGIKKYVTQYKSNQMKEHDLNEKMTLNNFLVDDGEIGNGMYLAGGYELFIKTQNNFLETIIDSLEKNKNSILYYYKENLKHKINVHKATNNEIVMKKFPEKCQYKNFLHLISINSHRNIYYKNEDSKINYKNYNNFIYDFDTIEEELGKILLTGKRLFDNNIPFVTYNFEAFRGEKKSNLIDFINLYPPQELTKDEKKDLFSYLKEKIKNNYHYDFSQLLFSIQKVIYFLTQERMNTDTKIQVILYSKPKYLNITNECQNLLKKLNKFNISKLFEILSFVELFSFDSIINNLKDEYKINIEENDKQKINNYFNNNIKKKITKAELACFCRKLITRYLLSNIDDNKINLDNSLSDYFKN